jgi:Putative F0F1-ATPase subunit Ca2+/Mg2+ transporter
MSDKPTISNRPDRATTVALLVTFGDTTWRMLVPSAAFVGAGIYGDLHLGTRPWLTLLGVMVGLVVSMLLIKLQIGQNK